MTSSPSRKPISWEDYERGRVRRGSVSSVGSHVHYGTPIPGTVSGHHETSQMLNPDVDSEGKLKKQRSSISIRFNSLAHAGGVNSIENFARSWQRAAGFVEIPSRRPSLSISDRGEDGNGVQGPDVEGSSPQHRSLLHQQVEREGSLSESVFDEGIRTPSVQEVNSDSQTTPRPRSLRGNDVIDHAPYLASPYASSFGGVYGSLSSRVNESSMRHAGRLFEEQQARGVQEPDKEQEPLLMKRVEREDGKVVHIVVGQSTLPQTVFNSMNILVGVGILSLPLGIKYSGWLLGMGFLIFSAITTRYTARILAKCLDTDSSLVTFADLAYVAFGPKVRFATSIVFFVELIGVCVALVVLFADSLDALIPGWGIVEWKLFCGIIMMPLSFIPLRLLSFTSFLGIVSCFGIVILVFTDGLLKKHTPGSLREPAATYLFPHHWSTVPLSFGLLISPWGGLGVFPNIYRDMRHPRKYSKSLNITYTLTYLLDLSMAVAGILMFGEKVRDEITSNIFLNKQYPPSLSVCIVAFIAIVSLTKIPLNARPIVVTLEILCGLNVRTLSPSTSLVGLPGYTRGALKCAIRVVTTIVIVLIAILVAYLGPASTYTHQAALNSFNNDSYDFIPQITTKDVFAAVHTSSALYGVVPFENSTNGSVINTLDLLIDREKISSDVLVCGEAFLPVHHCLLGHADLLSHHDEDSTLEDTKSTAKPSLKTREARPLFDLSRVDRVLSHIQAFSQCDKFLSKYLKGVECQEVSSTSKAAKIVAADNSGTSVAISSGLAAEVYGLDLLADGIQDREDNTTRFFILQRGPIVDGGANGSVYLETGELKWKTLVAFRVNHHSSGALADALQTFKRFHLNLTSINSRPSLIRPWNYIFLVELGGKREIDGSGLVNEALEELSKATSGWRWIGSWVNRMTS